MENKRIIKSICFGCHSRCGVILETKNGRLLEVKGDKEHPISKGFICPKCYSVKELIYHPERLRKPMKNIGKKGNWKEVKWKDALGKIGSELLSIKSNYGAESVVFGQGTTRGLPPYINRFLTLFGSPNYMGPQNLSGFPIIAGSVNTCGFSFMGSADFKNTGCILLWGHNPQSAWPGLYLNDIREGLRRGSKLIVVDPRRIPIANRADLWIQLRPGSDVALVLGMLNFIMENDLYDKDFVSDWTIGFEELREHARNFNPDKVAEMTWLDPEIIKEAAVIFSKVKPACIGVGMAGVCQNTNSFQLNRAITMLSAITGNLEIKGGNVYYSSPLKDRSCYGRAFDACLNLSPEQSEKRLGSEKFSGINYTLSPAESVWEAVLEERPYPVKALLLFANNSIISFANSKMVEKALKKLKLLVCVDYFHTPTTELADFVLPAAHWTERDDIEDLLMKNHLFCQPKAIEPPEECWDEKKMLIELAKEVGLKGYWDSIDKSLDYRLERTGLSFQEFKDMGRLSIPVEYRRYEKKGGFRTTSRKVELYSESLKAKGIPPLPSFIEPPESPLSKPELAKEYPFILITGGRNIVYYHSAHRNIPSLQRKFPDPTVEIHPQTLKDLNIKKEEWVWIVTLRGRIRAKVRAYNGINPKVVHVYHGFWFGCKEGWKLVNDNILTDNSAQDPAVGSTQLRGLLCKIEKD